MHFRAITRIVGLLVILFSGTMILQGWWHLSIVMAQEGHSPRHSLSRWRLAPAVVA
jgi:hypothetical protein